MTRRDKFGVIVGTRGFFNPALASEGRGQILARLDELGCEYVILPEDATPGGAVETLEDARKCADHFQQHRHELMGIIVTLPNFGDELGIVNTLKWLDLRVPVLVQADDDDLDKLDTAHRKDAFCGKLSVCNNLYQYGIPFTDTTNHTCKIEGEEFADDLRSFAAVCRVVNGLRSARIGALGARPMAFQTMRISEKLLQSAGITVVTTDLSEIIFAARQMDEGAAEVQHKLQEIRAYARIDEGVTDEQVGRQAKLCVALDNWVDENEIDALGVQCWTSIQENYGCSACLGMSMLSNRLIPAACEVDVACAVSMLALVLATGNPAAASDWNNNYGEDRSKCVAQHCSSYPRDFIAAETTISSCDVLGEALGRERCFGAIKGKAAAGPMSYLRISTDDRRGHVRAYVGDAEFTDDPFDMSGGIAVCKVPRLRHLLKHMCKHGFEHHVAMVREQCASVIQEALTTYLGWDVYLHE